MVQEDWTTEARREMEDPGQWDLEHAERFSGSRKGTSFVVRFSREESLALYAGARTAGVPVYEFLRQAALEKAQLLEANTPGASNTVGAVPHGAGRKPDRDIARRRGE